jgi:RHS repeat-associated protein
MPLALPAPLGESGAGGSAEPYTWVGRQGYQRDAETGFYFLRARMYDPSSGRFVLPDPVGFAAGDANLYRYCGNDPVNHTDPSGHFGLEEFFSAIDSFVPSRDNIIKWLLKGAGVDADRFWASIERCDGLNIVMYFDGDRIVGLFTNPSRFAPLLRTLTEATNEAFSEVQRTLWERGKGALALWLGVPVELFDLASNPTPERIFPALIRTLGWDWPTVLGKVKTKTGIDATALISIFHACAGLVSHDIGVAIDHMRREWLKDEPDFPAKLAKAMVEAREAIVRQVSTVVVQKMAIEFGKRLAGGGVGTFVKLGLDYAAAGAEHAGSLCDLLRGALEGFQALLADGPDGPRKDAVKRRLLESFDRALPLLFTGLSTGAGLGNPGRVVGEAVMAVQGRAGKPLDVLLEFLGKHFGQLADATFTRFGLMANDRLLPGVTRPLIAPVSATIGEHNARLWVSSAGTDRKPMILINPIIDMGANLRGQNVSPPPGRRWCRPVTAAWKRRSSGNSTS